MEPIGIRKKTNAQPRKRAANEPNPNTHPPAKSTLEQVSLSRFDQNIILSSCRVSHRMHYRPKPGITSILVDHILHCAKNDLKIDKSLVLASATAPFISPTHKITFTSPVFVSRTYCGVGTCTNWGGRGNRKKLARNTTRIVYIQPFSFSLPKVCLSVPALTFPGCQIQTTTAVLSWSHVQYVTTNQPTTA